MENKRYVNLLYYITRFYNHFVIRLIYSNYYVYFGKEYIKICKMPDSAYCFVQNIHRGYVRSRRVYIEADIV